MIVILDFGSQYTQLIARRLRENGIYALILPFSEKIDSIIAKNPQGIVLSGGPSSIYEIDSYKPNSQIFDLNIPILGICYGMQYIVDFFGGNVKRAIKQEFGKVKLKIINQNDIFCDVPDSFVWMSHADKVISLPKCFNVIATSLNSSFCALKKDNIYTLQFHPEVIHTEFGTKILINFATKICNIKPSWNMKNFLDSLIFDIRNKVGNNKVLCAVSGGVDSSVVAILLNKAIGSNCISVFVDTGLLRLNEVNEVKNMFNVLSVPLITINATDLFLNRLLNITDPEKKRRIIGNTFIDVFEKEASKYDIKFLAQGTLYPDVIESISVNGASKTIKSHHNVGGLPDTMNLDLIEPLRELFKDEVRDLGKELNIEKDMLMRHPFPGPGLAIRILGEVNKESLELLKKADFILIDELKNNDLYHSVWQAFCVLLNVKSVGVMGDNRTYDNAICIRCVDATDGMSASFSHLPHNFLESVSSRIVNEVNGINRVVFDITSKPPGTIEWE